MSVENKDVIEIIELFKAYLKQQTTPYIVNCVLEDLDGIKKLKGKLKLSIELPLQTIKEIFAKTGVIQLRPLTSSKKLLLGCGNTPCDDKAFDPREHAHEGFVTVNPQLTMNPSVIGAFGINQGLIEVLPKDYYEELYGEAITLATIAEDFDKETLQCMKKDFKTFEVGNPLPYPFEKSNLFFSTKEVETLKYSLKKYDQFDEKAGKEAIKYIKDPEVLDSYIRSLETEDAKNYMGLLFQSLLKEYPNDIDLQKQVQPYLPSFQNNASDKNSEKSKKRRKKKKKGKR